MTTARVMLGVNRMGTENQYAKAGQDEPAGHGSAIVPMVPPPAGLHSHPGPATPYTVTECIPKTNTTGTTFLLQVPKGAKNAKSKEKLDNPQRSESDPVWAYERDITFGAS